MKCAHSGCQWRVGGYWVVEGVIYLLCRPHLFQAWDHVCADQGPNEADKRVKLVEVRRGTSNRTT